MNAETETIKCVVHSANKFGMGALCGGVAFSGGVHLRYTQNAFAAALDKGGENCCPHCADVFNKTANER